MSFGVYVHIPYCLQRCTYCDFATYEQSKIMPPTQYLSLLFEEIKQTHRAYPARELSTVYFGGGTPSLLPAQDIVSVLQELAKYGFSTGPQTEITIEINPATISAQKMEAYLGAGINRFSVGAQTFDDALLKSVKREHDAKQTRETLSLLKSFAVNFSFDILFALPGQTLGGLQKDLDEVLFFKPQHVSPYCLTVPEGHVLSKQKLLEEDQLAMFKLIGQVLEENNYERYEISNFSLKGFESRHNVLYWDDSTYWSLGLSSHSYAKSHGNWGLRYWNPSSIGGYENLILKNRNQEFSVPGENLPLDHQELLEKHQALTDFCHTSLRMMKGLSETFLENKFGTQVASLVRKQLELSRDQGLVTRYGENQWKLTDSGLVLSNQVFAGLTYLSGELPS